MLERSLEYSGSSEESGLRAESSYRREHTSMSRQGFDHDGCEADELLLSEFLLSLQHGAAHHQDVSISGSGPTAVPRSFAKRIIKGSAAAVAGKASAAVRRTVVHRRKRRDDLAGPCNHCGALSSPQWRKGPKGKPVLCNACGIRFLRNRTLTKVMPKKRRHGAGGKRSRAAATVASDGDEDEFVDDTMTAADLDMDDDTYSAAAAAAGAAAAAHAYAAMHTDMQLKPNALSGPDAALYCPEAAVHPDAQQQQLRLEMLAARAAAEAGAAAAAAGDVSPAHKPFAAAAAAAPSVSRDSLFSTRSNSSRNLLAQLGDCPSLSLALALHQQQQQQLRQQDEADEDLQQHSSKYKLPHYPELQLFPPSSPFGESSGTAYVCSPARPAVHAALAGSSAAQGAFSPVCSSDSMLQLQQQHSSGSPPLSPLFLGAAAGLATAASAAAPATTATAGIPAVGQAQPGDILQLVQQLGCALGGVGPAIEFLKLCSGNPAVLAAAVSAVATSAAAAAP